MLRFLTKSIAGMDCLCAAPACRIQDRIATQITLLRRCGTDMDCFIGQPHMPRITVGIRVHRHRCDAELAAGGDDAAGDLAAIGDQDLVEIRLSCCGGGIALGHGKGLCTPPGRRALRWKNGCTEYAGHSAMADAALRERNSLLGAGNVRALMHCSRQHAAPCVQAHAQCLAMKSRTCKRASPPHIRNTPKRVGSIGAFNAADSPSPSTRRVSAGSMMPSSHKRALA